jgi:hypothetical protein
MPTAGRPCRRCRSRLTSGGGFEQADHRLAQRGRLEHERVGARTGDQAGQPVSVAVLDPEDLAVCSVVPLDLLGHPAQLAGASGRDADAGRLALLRIRTTHQFEHVQTVRTSRSGSAGEQFHAAGDAVEPKAADFVTVEIMSDDVPPSAPGQHTPRLDDARTARPGVRTPRRAGPAGSARWPVTAATRRNRRSRRSRPLPRGA